MRETSEKVLSEFVDTLNAYGSKSSEVLAFFVEYPSLKPLFDSAIQLRREICGGSDDIPEECWGVGCTACDGACENATPGSHKTYGASMLDLKQDDKVRWTEKVGLPAGEGRVKVFASTEMAVIGKNVIIEVLTPDTLKKLHELGYTFTHICLFEVSLEKVSQ